MATMAQACTVFSKLPWMGARGFVNISRRLYEQLHPETRHGAGTGSRARRTKNEVADSATSNGGATAADRFTKDAAQKTKQVRAHAEGGARQGGPRMTE
jgi:hypothetical protein